MVSFSPRPGRPVHEPLVSTTPPVESRTDLRGLTCRVSGIIDFERIGKAQSEAQVSASGRASRGGGRRRRRGSGLIELV